MKTKIKKHDVYDVDDSEKPGDEDIYRRAIAGYFRNAGETLPDQPNAAISGVRRLAGKAYVVLANVNGILAIYRVRTSGMLRRMRRWPKVLEG